jgi:hypothetical protein
LEPNAIIRNFFDQFAFTHPDSLGLAWTHLDADLMVTTPTWSESIEEAEAKRGNSESFINQERRIARHFLSGYFKDRLGGKAPASYFQQLLVI